MLKDTKNRGLYVINNTKNNEFNHTKLYQIDLPKIILNGANFKHNVKFLTDYIPQPNKQKYIQNHILELAEINANGITNSKIKTFNLDKEVSKNYERYKKDTMRFIAHAGGSVDGIKYTNTKEALDESYKKGFRLFELDIIQTKDGKYVASHNWKRWSEQTEYEGQLPVTLKQFMSKKYIMNTLLSI